MTKSIELADLKVLLEKTFKKQNLDSVVEEYGFKKRANGIYISNEMVTAKKPKYWLKCVFMGDLTTVTFSSVNKDRWDILISELHALAAPKPFEEMPSFKAEKYVFDKYIVETYEPIDGVNIDLNNLYDVLIRYR
ncbi:hypothetical protein ACFS6J_11960 [Olivibacter jilunii]|uniref:Uncharacterized protein n=2 Tax=Sphingobacteriaceae TaxID=84566 RepID=A0ABW6AZ54_9SPHI